MSSLARDSCNRVTVPATGDDRAQGVPYRAALHSFQMPRWFNLANGLTALRLVLVPFVIGAILDGRNTRAIELFAIAAATDVLDGAAARRLRLMTQSGAYLDPIADKCLLSGVFLALASVGIVPWWFVVVVFGRDLYILTAVGILMAFTRIRKFPPSPWGKISTFAQIIAAVLWMAREMFGIAALGGLPVMALWVSAAFTVWSGVHYTWLGFRVLRAH